MANIGMIFLQQALKLVYICSHKYIVMRKTIFTISILLTFQLVQATESIDSLLKVLDKVVMKHAEYSQKKEKKIASLKELLVISNSNGQEFVVCGQLLDEYFFYQKDSALVYAQKRLKVAQYLHDNKKIALARINLASTYGSIGMYKEALDILNRINITRYPDLRIEYYNANAIIYGYIGFYAASNADRQTYNEFNKRYYDSLLTVLPKDTSLYCRALTGLYFQTKEYDKAYKLAMTYYPKSTQLHEKAMIAYNFSEVCKRLNNKEQEMVWLAKAAINDLESVTKEYISLRVLAFRLYERGDLERAYNYMNLSYEDALFCNARLRTFEVLQMLPIVNDAYQHQAKTKHRLLIYSVLITSLLSLFLLLAIWRVYGQMQKLAIARKDLSAANDQLQSLNLELFSKNNTLSEANRIKEEYIGSYMDQCSHYIDKMDEYRKNLQKIAMTSKLEELVLKIKSKDFIDDVLIEFYQSFDNTFLHLFPNFVEELNDLLIPEERFHIKPGQFFNLELRIYALIRLGITDSVKIAAFLRCSTNTIYNYRTRNRNKALGSRDTFEDKVKLIGTLSK